MRQAVPGIGPAAEDGLVRDIWADPFDDAPRLIYADWLEDQGKPLQAALLRATPDQRLVLSPQLNAPMREDAPCSFTALPSSGPVQVGIPVRSLRSKAFEDRGPAWLRRHHVAEIFPNGSPRDWAGLFAAGWLAHTRGLVFGDQHHRALPALAASPHLATLASITFLDAFQDTATLTAFFRTAGLLSLCRLLCPPGREMPLTALEAIAEAPFAANLRHLDTGVIRNKELAYLAETPGLAGLVTLTLKADGDAGVTVLANATGLDSLRNLDLAQCLISDMGVDALAGSALLAQLRRLRLTISRHSTLSLLRLARAAPPQLLLVLGGMIDATARAALAAILGDRFILE
jgi:uncharacterized protein (TIGR02996 family)